MKKTLLLVYIHGFQGGEDTFGSFPGRLRGLLSRALPSVRVVTEVYPKYETRGDLRECVGRFREWLQNKVIDLEVENQTPSPTVDPSVHIFLIGHSMGGIVGAETLLLLSEEQPIPSSLPNTSSSSRGNMGPTDSQRLVEPGSFMFPHIQGLLTFDTPFLGIAPGVVSNNAEGQYKAITNTISDVAGAFGFGRGNASSSSSTNSTTASSASSTTHTVQETRERGNRETTPSSAVQTTSSTDVAAPPSWQRWGRYAMFAGAIGAAAAGGAAAIYQQRQNITSGCGWISSHLEFIGCLARPREQLSRLDRLTRVRRVRGIRGTNFYTCLGRGAQSLLEKANTGTTAFIQKIIQPKSRTFCFLPQDIDSAPGGGRVKSSSSLSSAEQTESGLRWTAAVNEKAPDEIRAHTTMFSLKENPGYGTLVHEACDVIANSVDRRWYPTATDPFEGSRDEKQRENDGYSSARSDPGAGFMDDAVVVN